MLTPVLVYRMQCRWLPIARDTFTVLAYGFLGFAKIVFLFFNLVPYIALLIVG